MLPSRCLRCGAESRDALCAACVEYLSGYHPLWLDANLLLGPTILRSADPRDRAWLAIDPTADVEWREAAHEDPATMAMAIVDTLRLGQGQALLSEGDAEHVHAFLNATKARPPKDPKQREALAALFRHIASIPSMPPHLADEYAARARSLTKSVRPASPPKETAPPPAEEEPSIPETPEPLQAPEEAEELVPEIPVEPSEKAADDSELFSLFPEEEEPVLEEAPIATPGPPSESEAPHEEVAAIENAARRAEDAAAKATEEAERAARLREEIEKDKSEMDSWVHREAQRIEAHAAEIREKARTIEEKESELRAKEDEVVAKVTDLQEKEREVRDKIEWAEKDETRRAVMEFLDTVPGMTIPTAKAITNAFSDLESLRAASVKALAQCKGVTEALATEIRAILAPGEKGKPLDHREQANALLEEGDTEAARRVIEAGLQEHPDDERLWIEKAELLVLMGRPSEALHCYNRVLDINRGNQEAWYAKANLQFAAGRHADAMDCLHEALRLDPSKAGDVLLKGEQLRIEGQLNEAAFLFQSVLDTSPENPRGILGLADCMQALGDIDAAEALIDRALQMEPTNPSALYRKGALLDRRGRWGAALQLYNRAIALSWDSPDAWVGKGKVLLRRGRYKEALESFDKALEFANTRVDVWLGKGQAHWSLGERESARAALDRARQLDPESPEAKRVAETFAGEVDTGEELPSDLEQFVEASESEREDTETLLQLAETALEGGDPYLAMVRFDQILATNPASADAWTGRGIALQQQEKYAEALACYDKAIALRPKHELATRWRQACLKRMGGTKS